MKRTALTAMLLAAVATSAGCSKAPPEAQFTMSAAQFVDEFLADRAAAAQKYGGTVVELTGTVQEKRGSPMTSLGIAFAEVDPAKGFESNIPLVFFDESDSRATEEFNSVAVGDAVRVRCRFEIIDLEREMYLVKNCRLVR